MPSHVGTVVVGGLLSEKEVVAEEFGGQPASSTMIPNFLFEQGKPRCLPNLLTRVIYNFMHANVLCTYI
jgi:hypothetical protein